MKELMTLTDNEKSAVFHHESATKLANSAIEHAVLSGKFLVAVKKECGHGNFRKRLEEMGIAQRTATNYMRLSEDGFANRHAHADLGVNAALSLLNADDDIKERVKERIEAGETVTQAEIERLKAEKADVERQKEEWRLQSIDQKHKINDLAQQLSDAKTQVESAKTRLKSMKEKTVYVTDDKKALESVRAVAEQKEKKLKTDLEAARQREKILKEKLDKAKDDERHNVMMRVREKLKEHEDKITDMQKQETSLRRSIEHLSKQDAELEVKVSSRTEHKQALSAFSDAALALAAAASVLLNDESPELDDCEQWCKQLSKARSTIDFFETQLEKHKTDSDKKTLSLVISN